MKWAARVLRFRRAAVTVLGLILLLGVVLRIQSYVFRRQAENLMADFQTLKLRQTKWPEAESLTRRWGKYGNYQGDCNASFCRYTIAIESPVERIGLLFGQAWQNPLMRPVAWSLLGFQMLGGSREADLRITFVVQDGVVLRKSAVFSYQVPSLSSEGRYALIATSRATSRLSPDDYFLTSNEQLAEHPYYFYRRPGGCSFCMMANVSFTPYTPESEMRWLTTFNLVCLTNFKPCRAIEDIYPASEGWQLYDGFPVSRPGPVKQVDSEQRGASGECHIPVFVLGREAANILSVTLLTPIPKQTPSNEFNRTATVRFDSTVKGAAVYHSGEAINVETRSYGGHIPSLTPGEHFLLLSQYREREQTLDLGRCLVLPNTPEVRAELQRGIAQNDSLRNPDPHASFFIPD
jgi:hypothetical protein